MSLTKTLACTKEELETIRGDNQLLISRNKSLMEEMKRNESLVVSRHLFHAVAISMQALGHNMLVTAYKNYPHDLSSGGVSVNDEKSLDVLRSQDVCSQSNSLIVVGRPHDVACYDKSRYGHAEESDDESEYSERSHDEPCGGSLSRRLSQGSTDKLSEKLPVVWSTGSNESSGNSVDGASAQNMFQSQFILQWVDGG